MRQINRASEWFASHFITGGRSYPVAFSIRRMSCWIERMSCVFSPMPARLARSRRQRVRTAFAPRACRDRRDGQVTHANPRKRGAGLGWKWSPSVDVHLAFPLQERFTVTAVKGRTGLVGFLREPESRRPLEQPGRLGSPGTPTSR
jgi:hypothetical protein